ncbi:MAG TPA: hypothetical protein VGM77_12390 [Gemmatimonadales bacterium]|jgi:hypothetical protein
MQPARLIGTPSGVALLRRSGLILIPFLCLACHRGETTDSAAFPSFDISHCDTAVSSAQSDVGTISTVAPGPNGALAWSAGSRATAIHLHANGRDTLLGRSGAGPGEFYSIGPSWWVADTLWVSDYRQGRSVAYTVNGKYLTTLTPPMPGYWVRAAGGRSVGIGQMAAANPNVVFLAYTPGQPLDTLGAFPAPENLRTGGASGPTPFTMRLVLPAWTPDGSEWCAVTSGTVSDIHLQCLGQAGARLLDTTTMLGPRAVTTADYEAVLASMVRGLDPQQAAKVRAETPKPAAFAAAFSARMDNQGRFWILRSTFGEPRQVWTLLSARGVPVRSLMLPAKTSLSAVYDDRLYVAAEQADGFQTLLSCRL